MAKNIKPLAERLLETSKKMKMNFETTYIDSGYPILNMIMSGGQGFPLGKVIQLYSESGYGKSTITLSLCKNLCKRGHKVLYIDAEGSIDSLIGEDGLRIHTNDEDDLLWSPEKPENPFIVVHSPYIEEAEKAIEALVPNFDDKGNPIDSEIALVVIDSVAALCPADYKGINGESLSVNNHQIGLQARLITNFVQKFQGYKVSYNMSFLFINQERENISLDFGAKFKDKVTGGRALEYYADIILKLTSKEVEKDTYTTVVGEKQNVAIGREVYIEAKKNKLVRSGIKLPLQVYFGKGISNVAAYFYLLQKIDITTDKGETVPALQGSGAWFTLTLNIPDENDPDKFTTVEKRLNGKDAVKNELKQNLRVIYPLCDGKFNLLEEEVTTYE